jgi:hypothetical protein
MGERTKKNKRIRAKLKGEPEVKSDTRLLFESCYTASEIWDFRSLKSKCEEMRDFCQQT